MPTLGKTIFELSRIYRLLNNHFYNGELETPIIAVQTKGKQNCLGWCSCKRIWKETKKGGKDYYEITITAEYLGESNEQIITTMLHEMVHLHCNMKNIKDTSRGNTYHNERFKEEAESHGLTIDYIDKYGWTVSELNEEALDFIPQLNINRQAFTIARTGKKTAGDKTKKKSSTRKYICPDCGTSVRATKEVRIICSDCMKQMLEEVTEEYPEVEEAV